jgi:hypothetical protein
MSKFNDIVSFVSSLGPVRNVAAAESHTVYVLSQSVMVGGTTKRVLEYRLNLLFFLLQYLLFSITKYLVRIWCTHKAEEKKSYTMSSSELPRLSRESLSV